VASQAEPFPHERATVPAALEMDPEAGLREFQLLEQQLLERFEDTQPFARPPAPGQTPDEGAPRAVAPAHPGVPAAKAVASAGGLDVAQAMVLSRRFGRVAPCGVHWTRLLERLAQSAGVPLPAPSALQLASQSKLLQRIALRDVLAWAWDRRLLDLVVAQLESVPEAGWTHMDG
jgi:hypothetical protein